MTEMESLKICKEAYTKRLENGDALIEQLLRVSTPDEIINQEIIKYWNGMIRQDEQEIDNTWSRKIEAMKITFKKDKENLKSC